MRNQWIIGAAGAIALAALSAGASAAPLSHAAGSLTSARDDSVVEQVAYRRCWWENGYRRCARVRGYGYGGYGYIYGRPRPEELRTGSKRWWDAMDFEDRGGRGGR